VADLVEVEQVADADRERMGAQRRVGDLLGERDRADDDDGRLAPVGAEECVEGGDSEPHEVRGRREVRLVGDAAARVEAHGPRLQPRAQVGGQVARLAVVAGDDERRPIGARVVGQRGDQVGAHRLRYERAPAVADEGGAVVAL
jgi:hypothetical protein